MGGWIRHRANVIERVVAIAGGLLLMYARIEADIRGHNLRRSRWSGYIRGGRTRLTRFRVQGRI
jgi:hypothetical protein